MFSTIWIFKLRNFVTSLFSYREKYDKSVITVEEFVIQNYEYFGFGWEMFHSRILEKYTGILRKMEGELGIKMHN